MNAAQKRLHRATLERDGYACQDCGGYADTVHHIVSRRYEGAWDIRNMITLCPWDHQGKNKQAGAHTREARIRHLALLIERHGYDYSDKGELWQGLIRGKIL